MQTTWANLLANQGITIPWQTQHRLNRWTGATTLEEWGWGGGLPWKPCQCAKVAPGLLVELVAVSSIGQLLVAFQQLPPSLLIGNRTEITPQKTQHFSVGFLREDVVYSLVLILFFCPQSA